MPLLSVSHSEFGNRRGELGPSLHLQNLPVECVTLRVSHYEGTLRAPL